MKRNVQTLLSLLLIALLIAAVNLIPDTGNPGAETILNLTASGR